MSPRPRPPRESRKNREHVERIIVRSSEPRHAFENVLREGLEQLTSCVSLDDGVCVTTHCMYPSNGLVQVYVRGGSNYVVVSDDGGALSEAMSAGIPNIPLEGYLKRFLADQGLSISDGVISSPRVPIDAAPMAVMLVANAAKDMAQWLYDNAKLKRVRDFRKLLAGFLEKTFKEHLEHKAIIAGEFKAHEFANVITLRSGHRLIVDPVWNDASSINSRVVANLDVKAAKNPHVHQRIVYDDEDTWSAADLNLLGLGAIPVPFSGSYEVIERLAASVG